jgi:hypothetical protein
MKKNYWKTGLRYNILTNVSNDYIADVSCTGKIPKFLIHYC